MAGLSPSEIRIPLADDGFFKPIITRGETALCESTADLALRGLPKLGRSLLARLIGMMDMERSVYAPLVNGDKTTGVLAILGSDLTEADLPAVALFASQASVAIENALLVEELRAGRERLKRLARQVVTAQEEERRRLSRALHDEAGQALTALKIGLELIVGDLSPELADIRRRMQDAANLTGQTMDRIRLLAQTLRPPALDSVGLNYSLQGLCQDFGERTRLSIHYHGQDLPSIPEPASIALYRCLQEALTNVAKHAAAREVTVTIRRDAELLRLCVVDDGRGFGGDAPAADGVWSTGIGILGMKERLEVLGGRLEIESRRGRGTRITALVPFEEA
jgi:signal transduction histidine kinase